MTAIGTTTTSLVPLPGHGVERLFLTAEEVAEVLHIGRTRVYALMAAREITSVKIGSLRRVPVDARALVRCRSCRARARRVLMAAARKRANGEGTIVKRPDGRYHAAAFVPVTGGGRRRVFVYGRTRADARAKLDELLRQASDGIARTRERQSVSEYLDYWLEHVVKPERRATTYNGYETMVRVHIVPVLGRTKLDELGPTDVRRLLAVLREKQTSGHGGGPRGLSPRMVQFAHAVLRNALSNAVREKLVSRNAAKLVRVSTPTYDVGTGLDPIAARAFIATITDDRLYALYLCAIVLGMRRGELLGLTWAAVDLDDGRLVVRQALSWVAGRAVVQPPKTRASRRVIPLPDVVVAALREHQARQDVERETAGSSWEETGFVFTTRQGRAMSPYTLTKYWHVVRERAGLSTLRFHDLRHTAVSQSGARRPAARRSGDRRTQ